MVYKRLGNKKNRGLLHALSLAFLAPEKSAATWQAHLGRTLESSHSKGQRFPVNNEYWLARKGGERIREVGGKERMSGELWGRLCAKLEFSHLEHPGSPLEASLTQDNQGLQCSNKIYSHLLYSCESENVRSRVWLFRIPCTVACQVPLSLGFSKDKNTGVGCHFLLQGIFPTQGLNLGFPHCRQILYHLSHQGSLSEVSLLIRVQIPRGG